MRYKKFTLVFMVAFLSCAVAWGEGVFTKTPLERLKFQISGGYTKDIGATNTYLNSFNGKFVPGFGASYELSDRLNTELLFSYSSISSQNSQSYPNTGVFINTARRIKIGGNIKYHLLSQLFSRFSPFIGVGLGYISDKYTTTNIYYYTPSDFNLSQSDIAANFLAGIEIELIKQISLAFRMEYNSFLTNRNKFYTYSPVQGSGYPIRQLSVRQDTMNYLGIISFSFF